MKFTWHFENGEKTQEFLRGGLSVTVVTVDYVGVVNEDTGATHRFESSKVRLTRRAVVLWESTGLVEAHKLGPLVGVTLEGIRRFPPINLTRVPGVGIRAKSGNTIIVVPRDGAPHFESIGASASEARRFMRWLSNDYGWGWVCDLM